MSGRGSTLSKRIESERKRVRERGIARAVYVSVKLSATLIDIRNRDEEKIISMII